MPDPMYAPGPQDPSYPPVPSSWAQPPGVSPSPSGPSSLERRNSLAPAIVAIVGAAILVISLIFPWYAFALTGHAANGTTMSEELDLDALELCVAGTGTNSGTTVSVGHCALYMTISSATGVLFFIPTLFTILGLIFGILSGVFGYRCSKDTGPVIRKKVKRPYSFARLALIFVLIAIILFLIFDSIVGGLVAQQICSPGSTISSFGGSCSFSMSQPNSGTVTGTMTWGPSTAFFVALMSFVLLLVSTIRQRAYFRNLERWDQPMMLTSTAPPNYPSY